MEQDLVFPEGLAVKATTDQGIARAWVKEMGERHAILADVPTLVFRGSTLYVLTEGGAPVSLTCWYFGRKKSTVWRPYANFYTVYTAARRRREGLATVLVRYVRQKAIESGCRRMKSLAGTMAGLCFHASFSDLLWGLRNDRPEQREVVVDTPLVELPAYAHTVPPSVLFQRTDAARPLSLEEVLEELGDQKLRYD